MSSRTSSGRNVPSSRRGRNVPTRKRSLAPIYALVGLIALIGIVGAALWSQNRATPIEESRVPADVAIKPFDAPVGTTDDGFFYKGSPDAPVQVIEYADFQCPGCGAFARDVEPSFTEQYVESGQVQFIYHEFPLQQHRLAVPAANAARCAGEQDPAKFWQMHDLIFHRQGEWPGDTNVAPRFSMYASEIGLDQAAFDQCMNEGRYNQQIQQAGQAATAAGATATPTFSVNGQLVSGPELQQAVDAALQSQGQ